MLLELYTGSGKSITSATLAISLGLRTLVVTTKVSLAKQWRESLSNKTNAKVALVGLTEFNEKCDIICCYSERIKNISSELLCSIGILIIDEVPYHCTKEFSANLLLVQPKYVIGCTARLERKNDLHMIGKLIIGKIKYSLKYRGPLTVCKIDSFVVPIIEKSKNGITNFSNTNKSIYTKEYCDFLSDICVKLVNKNYKILMLFYAVETLNKVRDYLDENTSMKITEFYGDKQSYEDGQVVLGTYSKISYGFDEEDMVKDWNKERLSAIIITDSIKDINAVEQCIGRVLRSKNPLVIDMCHKHRIYANHRRERIKYYEETDENSKIYKKLCYVNLEDIPENS